MKALITYAKEDNWYRLGEIYNVVSDGAKYAQVIGHWEHKGKTILLDNCELLFNQDEVNLKLSESEKEQIEEFQKACKARSELHHVKYLLRFIGELASMDELPQALVGYSEIRKHYQYVKERGNEADREALEEVIHYLGGDNVVADISPWNNAQLNKRGGNNR